MPDAVGSIGLNTEDFEKAVQKLITQELQKLQSEAQKTSAAVSGLQAAFGKIAGLFGVSLGLGQLASWTKDLVNFGAGIKTSALSAQLGIEQYQRLKQELTGFVGAQQAESTIQGVAGALREARNENPQVIQQFKNLGISWEELKNPSMDVKTIIEGLATSYNNASDKAEFLRRGTMLFGDSFLELIPALQQGGDALNKIGNESSVASSTMVDAAAAAQHRWEGFITWLETDAINAFFKVGDTAKKIYSEAENPSKLKYNDRLNPTDSNGRLPIENQIHKAWGRINGILFGYQNLSDLTDAIDGNPIGIKASSRYSSNASPRVELNPEIGSSIQPSVQLNPQKIDTTGGPRRNGIGSDLVSHALDAGSNSVDQQKNLLSLQEDLNKAEASRTPTLQSNLDILKAEESSLREQAKIQAGLGNDLQAEQDLIQANNAALAQQNQNFEVAQQLRATNAQRDALSLQINGQERLSKQTEIQAKYHNEILAAQRAGNAELANAYRQMQALELHQEATSVYLQTPGQRGAQHEEERRQHRAALRAANAGKSNPDAYDYSSSRGDLKFLQSVKPSVTPAAAGGDKGASMSVATLNVGVLNGK